MPIYRNFEDLRVDHATLTVPATYNDDELTMDQLARMILTSQLKFSFQHKCLSLDEINPHDGVRDTKAVETTEDEDLRTNFADSMRLNALGQGDASKITRVSLWIIRKNTI